MLWRQWCVSDAFHLCAWEAHNLLDVVVHGRDLRFLFVYCGLLGLLNLGCDKVELILRRGTGKLLRRIGFQQNSRLVFSLLLRILQKFFCYLVFKELSSCLFNLLKKVEVICPLFKEQKMSQAFLTSFEILASNHRNHIFELCEWVKQSLVLMRLESSLELELQSGTCLIDSGLIIFNHFFLFVNIGLLFYYDSIGVLVKYFFKLDH